MPSVHRRASRRGSAQVTVRGDQRRAEDVRVEGGGALSRVPCGLLGLDRELERHVLRRVASLPNAIEEVEPKFASEGFFD
jgi:hypothetical protein